MLGRLLRCSLRTLLGVKLEAGSGAFHDQGPVLIVANHPSALDPALLAAVLPVDATIIVPRRTLRSRLCRHALGGLDADVADLSEAASVRRIARLVARGRSVVLFPENRSARIGAATKVYEAPAMVAARTGVPVIPVHIRHGAVGAHVGLRREVTLTVGAAARIVLPPGLPARERRRQATDRLLSMMQAAAVDARPRQTLFDALVAAIDQHGRRTRIVEDVRQIEESYGTVLKASLALGRLIARVSAEREIVGVLLPNTVAAIGTVFGMSAMGRVPAMLNYSAGPQALRNAVHVAGIKTIVTSRRFVEAARLERSLAALRDYSVHYLEDMRETLGLADKLWLIGWALWKPRSVARPADPNALAIVLFTSGSEGKPKGVGLSHDAVLANMAQIAAAIDFGPTDKFLNALPMYHTYGLIACTLMPIVYGTRLFLYTNPLHYRIVPEVAYTRDCTYLFGTSTFLGNYARNARAVDFSTLRYVISGGEKLNPEVQRVYQERFGLRVFEGYGSTECGPAISLGTSHRYRAGTVGRLLPGVEHRIVPVSGIERGGILHVRSPNLMLGYFLHERPGELQPVASELGPGWHSMGDVVELDEEGYVTVLGRLKRFAKVAGEMVALESVERLARECSPGHQHAATVVVTLERGETTVLFTTDAGLDRMKLHHTARALGMQDLAVARNIVHVTSLPVLGSGKTDYVTLAELAQSTAPEGSSAARAAASAPARAAGDKA